MKKIGALALALTLAGSLSISALAAGEHPMLISTNPNAGYTTTITVNGTTLDTATLPGADGIPMRLVAEADHGSATWSEEENSGFFYMDGLSLTVSFTTGAVTLGDKVLEGVTAEVKQGITFLPVSIFEGMEGYTVNLNPELDVNKIDIVTPNNDPLIQLAYQVMETAKTSHGMKSTAAEMEEYHGITAANFSSHIGFFPMMTTPDTVIIGKVTPGKQDAIKAELEAYCKKQTDTFSWYLSQNLPKVENAKIVFEGDYMLFLIAGNAEAGVETFQTWVKAQ